VIVAATIGHSLSRAGLLLDALLAAAALLAAGRARRCAVAAAIVLTPLLLAGALWKSSQLLHLRHHPALAVAGIVAGAALIGGLAVLYRSRPRLLVLCAVIALPFRFSLLSGGTGGVLLILYAVIGAGAVALALWGEREEQPAAGSLELAIAAFVVLYAIQALYTPDLAKASQELCFFYVPFSLLFVMLRGVRWDRALLQRCAHAVLALALLFVAVAAVEYASRRLLFHAALNGNQRYFRVNSLFYDPNIYGRFLALTMVLLAAALMWESRLRAVAILVAILALLWLGLLASVSQSSFLALLAGLAVIAAARLPPRATAAGAAIVLTAGVIIAIAASGKLHLSLSDSSAANNTTGGRASLVRQGADIFAKRPLAGYGSGSFSCEYLRRSAPAYRCGAPGSAGVTSDSHTTPITIAAEQGVLGLLAYLALLVAAVLALARGGLRSAPVRVAILAAFVGLVVHTWAYADFLEDPITWALLAVGAVLARAPSAAGRAGT
jgi:O-antigen ligase